MIKRASIFVLLAQLTLLALPRGVAASSDDQEKFDALHHSANAYYLDIAPLDPIELPRIFIVRYEDGSYGLNLFRSTSSAILNGHYVSEIDAGHGGEVQGDDHEVEGDTHAETQGGITGEITGELIGEITTAQLEGHLVPPGGSHVVLDLSISRHLFFAWLAMGIVLLIMTRLAGMYKKGIGRETAPRGLFQNMFEGMVVFIRDDIVKPNLGDKTDKYLPYLLTAFFFILTANLLGLVPFGATATSNLMVTVVLASFTFVFTQLGGTKTYWMHIFWPPGIPTFVKPILMPVEVLGILTKPIALAIRLFANMTAGHLGILSLIGLIFSFTNIFGSGAGYGVAPVSVAFALFIYFLELLVSFIQAYVFTMLSALFIGMAIQEHEAHDDAHQEQQIEASASPEAEPVFAN
jgi:F-type H+-transporting ATPase subunit a